VTMSANYLSAESNQNDLVRYDHITSKSCDPWSGCHISTKSVCFDLQSVTNYLYADPDRIADETLAFFHTTKLPADTPTMKVDFLSPGAAAYKAQAFVAPVADDVTENVQLWGNWLNVKKEYRRGKKLANYHLILYVRDPSDPPCDQNK